jgi:fermentation-respiration switch protein FrsA (DUF1100 family)
MLYLMQTALIFPGRESQGQAWAQVTPPPGTELATLTTAGGDRTVALFGRALGPDGAPLDDAPSRPTILYFYGNGDSLKNTSSYMFGALRRLGANVCVPEYVGYGMSTGDAGEKGCYASADAAYEYLLTRADVDRSKIVAMGWSLGAAVAVDLASRRPVAGLAMFSAFTSMADMAREVYPFIPGASLILRHRFESLSKIARVTCPVIVGHGTSDQMIPFSMGEQLAAAAKAPVTFLAVEGAEHADIFSVGETQIFPAVRRLVDSSR